MGYVPPPSPSSSIPPPAPPGSDICSAWPQPVFRPWLAAMWRWLFPKQIDVQIVDFSGREARFGVWRDEYTAITTARPARTANDVLIYLDENLTEEQIDRLNYQTDSR